MPLMAMAMHQLGKKAKKKVMAMCQLRKETRKMCSLMLENNLKM
jgi:hypothetical protein